MSKEYSIFGPSNTTQTLAVCGGCAYRKSNQSKPISEIDVCADLCYNHPNPPKYHSVTVAVWEHDKTGYVHDCNRNGLKNCNIQRPCAGALLMFYRLRGTNAWTEMMEKRWQAGEYPKIMATNKEEIGI